ncbi:inositol 1,3,4-trisphosphate 5/6-kinase, putative [Entamoeba histolytica HM-1:IMSS-B]|uniref:inositol-1,3,4-trisphosphate 5/6-kinase n=6 Tax=Entamoeba histolytica TaxID=5759 RepID=C4M4G6_ENTH1|nr:inositol 1,3,4-trisphosphate 5/6-kinase [Entamoeba histolytica HM-1:IMSS]EMD47665.1 inositol 1,3,4trisphosphate 5/6-kinase, putative [Entamoeba histolytica KU27]EMH78301.1 inositol 1,3,4-trisphosphate 5/6-kinase, putative [Entamoeba histolytica HM-1:IMSS-B]EMS14543.1 inositol 1,3,4-trisphosphate 5/6-kinase [Entamoeba histolytica HM-3:IMSS]ENY62660.1 inositol 1,3,4-trisphosphate 5/6-kinase, putative [Entamoeba histolytica HM-1:IMSS-A]GAT96265.1 inositol 1 3 4-trisphosphate 5 6-kinase [Entamo|eukprot:XP_656550.1 inositol 1,3,4-trisphosphate 5/6-kinase [Entamoeba histolytica HM-1:IMSS]
MKKVIIHISDAKKKKMGWNENNISFCYKNNVINVYCGSDLTQPFDILLPKIINDQDCQRILDSIKNNPDALVIDPIQTQQIIQSRKLTYERLTQYGIDCPRFIVIQSHQEMMIFLNKHQNIHLPVITKPIPSQGSHESHEMTIINHPNGFNYVKYPCVIQEYINHNGQLTKVFCIGKKVISSTIQESLGNIDSSCKLEYFSFNNEDPESKKKYFLTSSQMKPFTPMELQNYCDLLSKAFNITLFGFDIIRENGTGKPYIIDINHFPSYNKSFSLQSFTEELLNECGI